MSDYLRFSDVTFRYLQEAKANTLEHVDFSVTQGKITVIAGSSGCGKSTLALLAAGIYPANGGQLSSGEISLCGHPLEKLSVTERTRLLSVLFQNPDLQFCMDTLRKEFIFCLENLSVPPSEMEEKIAKAAGKYEVTDLLDRKFHTLSGGEKQKAALCCLLLLDSKGIIMDEPFANLDPASAKIFIELIRKIVREENRTILVIDHRLDYWLEFADEIIVLGDGGRVCAREINAFNIAQYRSLFLEEGLFFPEKPSVFQALPIKGKNLLTAGNLTVGYPGKHLLTNAEAVFPAGSMTALLGGSGSGKTTFFSAVLGQKKYTGSLLLEGKEISGIKKSRLYSNICAVFQNPASQFVALNVLEEVVYSLRLWNPRFTKEQLETGGLELLEQYGLKKYRNFSPYMLSQGQQRRLAVLSMLAGPQKLLLLDEPTYGQDQKNTDLIMSHLKRLVQGGMTVIFSTHDVETAVRYSNMIYEIKEGRILPWNG